VGVPEDGRFVVVGVGVEWGAECLVVLVVVGAAAAGASAGGAVVDRAEARGGEGGEDAGVGADLFGGALAAAQARGDQVEGVAAVDLGAGHAPGGAAVVAADEEVPGREVGGVEVVEDADGCSTASSSTTPGAGPRAGSGASRLEPVVPDAPEAYGAMITRAKAAPAQSRSADLRCSSHASGHELPPSKSIRCIEVTRS
jgi:hypothetical protein